MTKCVRIATLLCSCLLGASLLNSSELLAMRVAAYGPASLTVQIMIKSDAGNRALAVTAEAPDFYRSSQIPLDGERAPRVAVFHLRSLPTDVYQVTGILVGPKGPRAKVTRIARVLPEPGTRR